MTTATAPNNLPAQLSSFVGREAEIAEVKRLLASTRLLTLVGSGGAGKTRLALEVAAEVVPEYEHGLWLVELAALSDPALLQQAVARVLGLREASGQPLSDTLSGYLRGKRVLLLLDNCEHLIADCARLAERLLRDCPELRIFATSREGLGISGETTWRVPSLTAPDARRLPPLETLTQYEAVRLFIDRAKSALPSFAVTNENAPAVAQICYRLDGIPLAIELAAARVKGLPAEQIAARLDDQFRLLTGGSRTALPRQQTLRACIDWSHDLLGGPERTLLRRLSVFTGGCSLEAAEAVCPGGDVEADLVLDPLTGLVDKSLIQAEEYGGVGRYRLLETVRQYAADRLRESGEVATLRDRHLGYFLRLAEESERAIQGAEGSQWLARLEMEHENLRAALQWGQESGEIGTDLRLAAALCWFWLHHGHWREGRQWLEGMLSRDASGELTARRERARALVFAGHLAWSQGEHAHAGPLFEEGLDLARRIGDRAAEAHALLMLGVKARSEGDLGPARSLIEDSLRAYREIGDRFGAAHAGQQMSVTAQLSGDYRGAVAWIEESLALGREIPSKIRTAHSLSGLGVLAALKGEHERAILSLKEALSLHAELGHNAMIAYDLLCLAGVIAATGPPLVAARLFGAAEAIPEGFTGFMTSDIRAANEAARSKGAAVLGEERFAAAVAEGRVMTLAQAVAYALDLPGAAAQPGPATAATSDRLSPAYPPGLTGREIEVLRLVAQGLTSAQVAERLIISTVTVSTHLRNIYSKIGVNSRAAATRWAVDHGLA
jgi:non-specific serine/threonine protein kinase